MEISLQYYYRWEVESVQMESLHQQMGQKDEVGIALRNGADWTSECAP
jgi:hypothetical protein